jgi:hypothetical protein
MENFDMRDGMKLDVNYDPLKYEVLLLLGMDSQVIFKGISMQAWKVLHLLLVLVRIWKITKENNNEIFYDNMFPGCVSAHAVFNTFFINRKQNDTCIRAHNNNSPVTNVMSTDMRCNKGGAVGVPGICAVQQATMSLFKCISSQTIIAVDQKLLVVDILVL